MYVKIANIWRIKENIFEREYLWNIQLKFILLLDYCDEKVAAISSDFLDRN